MRGYQQRPSWLLRAGGLEAHQLAEAAFSLPVETSLLALKRAEIVGTLTVQDESAGQQAVAVPNQARGRIVPAELPDPRLEDSRFPGEATEQAPVVDGHAHDQVILACVRRLEAGTEVIEEWKEDGWIFALEQSWEGVRPAFSAFAEGPSSVSGAVRPGGLARAPAVCPDSGFSGHDSDW